MAYILPALIFGGAIAWLATPYMGAATTAYALMLAGIFTRKRNRRWHRRYMYSAMGLDLGLVLLLEFQRGAIGTVVALNLTPWQLAHVFFSVLAVLTYGPLIYLGTRLWRGENVRLRARHRRLGWLAFSFRTLGFLLMFSLIGRGA